MNRKPFVIRCHSSIFMFCYLNGMAVKDVGVSVDVQSRIQACLR